MQDVAIAFLFCILFLWDPHTRQPPLPTSPISLKILTIRHAGYLRTRLDGRFAVELSFLDWVHAKSAGSGHKDGDLVNLKCTISWGNGIRLFAGLSSRTRFLQQIPDGSSGSSETTGGAPSQNRGKPFRSRQVPVGLCRGQVSQWIFFL